MALNENYIDCPAHTGSGECYFTLSAPNCSSKPCKVILSAQKDQYLGIKTLTKRIHPEDKRKLTEQ